MNYRCGLCGDLLVEDIYEDEYYDTVRKYCSYCHEIVIHAHALTAQERIKNAQEEDNCPD